MVSGKLPSRWEGYEERLPRSLDDLHGPAEGTLTLPIDICWSGMRTFDLDQYRFRLAAYHTIVTEVRRSEDAERYLNAHHLLEAWPQLRRLLGPQYRNAWESRLPELATTTGARRVRPS